MSGGHHHGHSHSHGHGHAHGHSHSHAGHSHAPADFGRAFAIGVALNLGFVLVEGLAGLWTGSMALLADAGHNLSDVLGLLIAWGGASLAKRPASRRFTYGYSSSTILGALANGVLLLFAAGAIAIEAVRRFTDPAPVPGMTVMIVAGIGILINAGTAMMFMRGAKNDINIRGAYLHMAADAGVSLGVLIGGALILATGVNWVDPVISLIIVAVIIWSTWGLLRDAVVMSLHAVPSGIDSDAVDQMLRALPGVAHIHDLHIWPIGTTEVALTVHLAMPSGHPGDQFLQDVQRRLEHEFGIGHATLQIELGDNGACELADAHQTPAS